MTVEDEDIPDSARLPPADIAEEGEDGAREGKPTPKKKKAAKSEVKDEANGDADEDEDEEAVKPVGIFLSA